MSGRAAMIGIRSFIRGFGFRNVRPAAFVWVFNFAFALVVYYGTWKFFSFAFGESLLAEGVTPVGLFTLVSDLVHHFPAGVWVIASLGFFFVGFFLIVSIFLSGGVYSILILDDEATFFNLFSAAIKNFIKLAVVFLINIGTWLAFGIFSFLALFGSLTLHSAVFWRLPLEPFIWAGVGLMAVFLLYASAVHDFSKIFCLRGERNGLASFGKALRFVFAHKIVIAALSILYLAATGTIFLMYRLLWGSAERAAAVPIAVLFAAFEAVIYFRCYLKTVLIRAWIDIVS